MLRIAEEAHRSDTGRQRQANEDSYFARAPVYAVADGMGGARAGEVASRMAAEAFEPQLEDAAAPEEQLRKIVVGANRRIHELAERDASRAGMGTTLTAALVSESEVTLAHVGDSRAYVFREGALKQLTQDHSLVEELRRQGRLTDSQAAAHPQRSVITRALGPEPKVEVDTMTYPARPGDVFLLCSDGLTTMVEEDRIAELMTDGETLEAAVQALVHEANSAGGRDNITVVLFRVEEVGSGVGGQAVEERETLAGEAAAEAGLTVEAVREAAAGSSQTVPATSRGATPPSDDDPEVTLLRRAPLPEEAPAPAPQARPGRWRGALIRLGAGLVAVAAVTTAAVYGVRQVYFVGADERGVVALYRGLPYELPFGADLYDPRYTSAVGLASLPPDRRRRLLDHTLRSRADAVDIIERLERNRGLR